MQAATARRAVCCALLGAVVGVGGEMTQAQRIPVRNEVLALDQGWQFRQIPDPIQADPAKPAPPSAPMREPDWLPATVPGDVHLDLLANKKIPDPFYRDNEAKLQWIEDASWEYQTTFEATPELLARSHVDLVFEGVDSAARVYLNGTEVLEPDNAFRIWRVPAKSLLHVGKNVLLVVFPSPIAAAEVVAATDPWQPKTKTAPKTYIRKPAYEYGWDWGPRFVTSGIWKPVRLEAWDKVRIADFAIRQRDVSAGVAHLDAQIDLEAAGDAVAAVTLHYAENGRPMTATRAVSVHAGHNLVDLPIEIPHPSLWYPAGYGAQPLYDFTAQVSIGGQAVQERKTETGLRSVVLRRRLDKWGRSFEFVVNGIPVFAKGADVIPFDSFPNRVTVAEMRHILESARDANMNMIRVWGGGYYETDEFYKLCDQLGIMVWQDFMFGNDWQPGAYAFKQNVEAEAVDQVKRLRNHPSIVLWCGNNETESAFDWVGRPDYPPDVRLHMWQDYLTVFSGILPTVVAKLDSETPYWPSSPSADYEQLSDHFQSGDAHIWDVWHGRVPFSTYETHHARFVSEYGFQSFPEMRSIDAFTEPSDRTSIFTPVMLAHQKNNEGNSIIHDYLLRDYSEPKDFASFLYVSQVLQAEGIKIGAEHFRRDRPETMGSLFWQLNDCWPVASWSSIDYYGRWKALQYYARRFYAPILVSPHVKDGAMKVYIVSDRVKAEPAHLRVRLMNFNGKVLLEENRDVTVAPLSSQVYFEWPLKKLDEADANDASQVFIVADLTGPNGEAISRNLIYLAPTKQIRLIPAKLTVKTAGADGSYKIDVTSPVLARDVYLSFGNLDVHISDNFFNLLPGETAEIAATSAASLDALQAQLKVISLTDAFAPAPPPATVPAAPESK